MFAKNLLDEFDKDDTLEPNMSVSIDGKNKLTQGADARSGQLSSHDSTPGVRQRVGSDNVLTLKEQ